MKYNLKFWKTFYKIRYCPSITKRQTVEEVKFIKEFLPIKKYKNILDFICGFGRHSIILAKAGYNIEGFDIDRDSIQQAKNIIQKFKFKNINLYIEDALKFQKRDFFDATICLYSSIGFGDKKSNNKIFKNLFQSVKNKGRIILDVINPEWATKNLTPYFEKTILYKERNYFIKHKRKILYNPMREQNIIDFLDEKKKREYSTSYILRLISLEEIKEMLLKNNFKIYKIFGSFNKNKISTNYQRIIIIADKI